MIKYLRIQQQFDAGRMQQEMALLEEELWKQHYNKQHYEGGWSVLPLRSINGSTGNIIAVHSSSHTLNQYQDTVLLEKCSYIRSVLNYFECEKTSVRLMKLEAGSVIKEHSDYEMSFEEGEVRLHIPVVTNPDVEFFLDDERVVMQEGECWYLNLSLKHSVKNLGSAGRVHLVIDCIVNDWIRDKFTHQAAEQKLVTAKTAGAYSGQDKLKIVAQLRLLNTPVSNQLAAQMEKELNSPS